MRLSCRGLCWLPIALLGFAGCQPTTETARVPINTPEVLAQREQFQLTSEPASALPLGEIPALFAATTAEREPTETAAATAPDAPAAAQDAAAVVESAERDVVFVARVGGVPPGDMTDDPDFPWEPGRAAFVVSDPTTAEHADHGHAGGGHDNCPFCAKEKAAGPIALVRCLGTDGEALSVDARDLFTIAERDLVVVEGTARMVGDTLIVVDAKGIYVRR